MSLVIMISKTPCKYEISESTSLIWSWVRGETNISVYSEDLTSVKSEEFCEWESKRYNVFYGEFGNGLVGFNHLLCETLDE